MTNETDLQDIKKCLPIRVFDGRDVREMFQVRPPWHICHAEICIKSTERKIRKLNSLHCQTALVSSVFKSLKNDRPEMFPPFSEIVRMQHVIGVATIRIRIRKRPEEVLLFGC